MQGPEFHEGLHKDYEREYDTVGLRDYRVRDQSTKVSTTESCFV
jgi:hypothetical protein